MYMHPIWIYIIRFVNWCSSVCVCVHVCVCVCVCVCLCVYVCFVSVSVCLLVFCLCLPGGMDMQGVKDRKLTKICFCVFLFSCLCSPLFVWTSVIVFPQLEDKGGEEYWTSVHWQQWPQEPQDQCWSWGLLLWLQGWCGGWSHWSSRPQHFLWVTPSWISYPMHCPWLRYKEMLKAAKLLSNFHAFRRKEINLTD